MAQKRSNLQPYENATRPNKKDIIINNFIGGISWAIGGTVGLAVILYLLTLLAKNGKVIPIIGSFVADVAKVVEQKNGHALGR